MHRNKSSASVRYEGALSRPFPPSFDLRLNLIDVNLSYRLFGSSLFSYKSVQWTRHSTPTLTG